MDLKHNIDSGFFNAEVRDDYYISSDMKRVWAVEIDLLIEFQRVCKKHELVYYANGGTLIGAVRHEGFIPWDDDIDLMMPRRDFNMLCKIANEEFKEPYFFQTDETDYGFNRDFARLRNSSTTGIQKIELNANVPYNQGIFIDIFPLDNIPNDGEERRRFLNKLNKAKDLSIKLFRFSVAYVDSNRGNRIKQIIKNAVGNTLKWLFGRYRIKNLYLKKYIKLENKYNQDDTNQWGLLWFYGLNKKVDATIWDKKDFVTIEQKKFEFISINIPSGYDEILKHTYGNWREFVKGNNIHGNMIFDTEKPYSEYLKV